MEPISCTLGKDPRLCRPWQCNRCGFEKTEIDRRLKIPLTLDTNTGKMRKVIIGLKKLIEQEERECQDQKEKASDHAPANAGTEAQSAP